MNPCSRTGLGKQPGQSQTSPSFSRTLPGQPEQGHCSAAGVPRCLPQGLEVPVGPWPKRALSILHRDIQTPPALISHLQLGCSRPCDVNRTGTAGTGGIAKFKCWMRSHRGWQLQGMGGHCPDDGRGKLGGVVPRQTRRSALQAVQPLCTGPCSPKQAGSAGQARCSHGHMRGSEQWEAECRHCNPSQTCFPGVSLQAGQQ